MWTLLLKLCFAHVIADFILQWDALVQKKNVAGAQKYLFIAAHSLIHAVTAYIFAGLWTNWLIPLIVTVSHFIIDTIKIQFKQNTAAFIIDQLCHLAVLLILALSVTDSFEDFCIAVCEQVENARFWCYVLAYIIILKPASILLSLFIGKWSEIPGGKPNSLQSAGQWIGYFERILVLTFIFTGNPEGIGFLLAAKSIFRFGELKNPKEIRITEYVLIGTLSSFTIAILVGYCTIWLISMV